MCEMERESLWVPRYIEMTILISFSTFPLNFPLIQTDLILESQFLNWFRSIMQSFTPFHLNNATFWSHSSNLFPIKECQSLHSIFWGKYSHQWFQQVELWINLYYSIFTEILSTKGLEHLHLLCIVFISKVWINKISLVPLNKTTN